MIDEISNHPPRGEPPQPAVLTVGGRFWLLEPYCAWNPGRADFPGLTRRASAPLYEDGVYTQTPLQAMSEWTRLVNDWADKVELSTRSVYPRLQGANRFVSAQGHYLRGTITCLLAEKVRDRDQATVREDHRGLVEILRAMVRGGRYRIGHPHRPFYHALVELRGEAHTVMVLRCLIPMFGFQYNHTALKQK